MTMVNSGLKWLIDVSVSSGFKNSARDIECDTYNNYYLCVIDVIFKYVNVYRIQNINTTDTYIIIKCIYEMNYKCRRIKQPLGVI